VANAADSTDMTDSTRAGLGRSASAAARIDAVASGAGLWTLAVLATMATGFGVLLAGGIVDNNRSISVPLVLASAYLVVAVGGPAVYAHWPGADGARGTRWARALLVSVGAHVLGAFLLPVFALVGA
jgi:hypothetical protein